VSVYRRFLLTGAEADVEHHLSSTGQQAAQNQGPDQARINSTKPPTPPGHGSSGRQLDPPRRIILPSPTPEGDGFDNIWYRHRSHPLCSPGKPQGAQKERDVDRVEAGGLF
jgi:hypothetical protein